MRKLALSLTALIVAALAAPCATSQQSCAPTPELKAALESQWPGWSITTSADLDAQSRKLWLQTHHDECPGMATGHITAKSSLDIALNIKRAHQQAVLLFTPSPDGPGKLQVLNKAYPCCAVISILPPRTYNGVKTSLDGINFEAIGAASQLIYFQSGAFRRLQLSD